MELVGLYPRTFVMIADTDDKLLTKGNDGVWTLKFWF